ncbi:MAG: hypothetical protein KJ709_06340 [Nanoarchaeota archaeon]|nr:hypothetical protein [Nanoarchaeota archaeon]
MRPSIGVCGSAGQTSKETEAKAFEIGREIAKRDVVLLTGATTGVSLAAAKGARSEDGLVIGISPAPNREKHKELGMPVEPFDSIIFTGHGWKGRNVIFVRSCDAVVIIAGMAGTLNKFTVAFDDEKYIGVLKGSGFVTELLPQISKAIDKGGQAENVFFESDSKALIGELVERIKG